MLGVLGSFHVKDFIGLTKPRLGFLVMLTVLVGLMTTHPAGPIEWKWFWGLGLIAMVVMGATSLNCYLERDLDALMERTKERALPAGRVTPLSALCFGLFLMGLSLPLLYLTINPLSAFLAAMAALIYLLAYTPLKVMSPLAVYIGALPGALPPMLGRTMVFGEMDAMAWVLFGILFFWQIPHFLAISIYHAQDYRNASILVYGNTWDFYGNVKAIFFWTFILSLCSFLPMVLGSFSSPYLFLVGMLNALFLGLSLVGYRFAVRNNEDRQKRWARVYFWGSLFYLPLLLCIIVFCQSQGSGISG